MLAARLGRDLDLGLHRVLAQQPQLAVPAFE
jgi:hypothetical protein